AKGGIGAGGAIGNGHPVAFETTVDTATLTLNGCTLTANLAQGGKGGAGASGGDGVGGGIEEGLLSATSPPTMSVIDTLIAGNFAVGGIGGSGGQGGNGLGGGVYVAAGASACFQDSKITLNF